MIINSNFDGGNIEVISVEDPDNIQLAIRKDVKAKYLQWFYFNFIGKAHLRYKLNIINASKTTYPKGWLAYKALASYDQKEWFRVPTSYDGEKLSIIHELQHDSVYYAYAVPYSYERHQTLINKAILNKNCQSEVLCKTVNGNECTLLTIGNLDKNKKKFWIIGRQHSGETMAEWFCEGLINRLLNSKDNLVSAVLAKANFYIVPNMNPDGSILGNLRANGAGINLNRQWQFPDKNIAPEVYFVQEKMKETGVNFFFDVHGDEEKPYVFTLDNSLNPSYTRRIKNLEKVFKEQYMIANLDFQTEEGYESNRFVVSELLTTAPYAVCQKYDCLALTLEMPFTDNFRRPDEKYGWSHLRSIQMGASLLELLLTIVDNL